MLRTARPRHGTGRTPGVGLDVMAIPPGWQPGTRGQKKVGRTKIPRQLDEAAVLQTNLFQVYNL